MDEFEREYFARLKTLVSDYQSKRRELAKSRIKMFVAALERQLIDNKEDFDLIIAAGNSGLYMQLIAKMVYERLRIKLPKIITLPIIRFQEVKGKISLDDNSSLRSYLSGKLNDPPTSPNILFIDDEIMMGLTVKIALELILSENPNLDSLRCTIIAENHFFEWHHRIPKVSINFFAYSRLIQGLNGNIGYFIPEDLYSHITSLIKDVASYNHAMSVVIGGALKRKNEQGVLFYDTSVHKVCAENIANYNEIKASLLKELEYLVGEAVEKYKEKKIKFRF